MSKIASYVNLGVGFYAMMRIVGILKVSGDMHQHPRVTSRSPSPQGDQVQGHGVQAGGQRALVCGVVYLSQDTLHATAFSGVDMMI